MIVELPIPPSVNDYWRMYPIERGGRATVQVAISPDGERFRQRARIIANRKNVTQPLIGRLRVDICARFPDRRRRDLDNILKATLDALEHAEFYENDNQIDDLRVWRGPIDPGAGRLVVELKVTEAQRALWKTSK